MGNKVDLREDPLIIAQLAEQRLFPVSKGEGIDMGKRIKAVKYVECSAKTQRGLKEVFTTAAEVVVSPELYQANTERKKKKVCLIL